MGELLILFELQGLSLLIREEASIAELGMKNMIMMVTLVSDI